MDTKTVELKLVHVDRGHDTVPVHVPEHEAEVLKAVHGLGAVRVVGDADEQVELSISADSELLRLQRKYYRVNAPDPALIAFRGGAHDLERYGFKLGRAPTEEAPMAGVRHHKQRKKPGPKPASEKAAA